MDRGYDTRSPIQKTSSLPKTFALFRAYAILVFFIIFGSLFFTFAHAPLFKIRSIVVSGSNITPNQNIEMFTAKVLEGNWRTFIPFKTTIGVPIKTLEESILKTFPSVKTVSTHRVGISHLHISITEKTPEFAYCKSDTCVLVDDSGVVFTTSYKGPYQIIEGSPAEFLRRSATTTEDAILLGGRLFPENTKAVLDKARDFLIANNFSVEKMQLSPLGFFDVHATSLSSRVGLEFRFRANQKIDEQIHELALAFEKGLRQKIDGREVEYVISYVPQKVIYKNTGTQN